MFGWLFKSKSEVIETETMFSKMPIGRQFQKLHCWDENVYVKTTNTEYETIENGYHCTKWYRVNEDFVVKVL